MEKNVVKEKSKQFALDIIVLYKQFSEEKKEFILSKQIMKSGTSIGANVREAQRAKSILDFYSKMNIALKEAEETLYWLELLQAGNFITTELFNIYYEKCEEIVRLLVSITKQQMNY